MRNCETAKARPLPAGTHSRPPPAREAQAAISRRRLMRQAGPDVTLAQGRRQHLLVIGMAPEFVPPIYQLKRLPMAPS